MSKKEPVRRFALEEGAAVLIALGLDITGEPPTAWHPVVWFGKLIQRLERAAPQDHLSQVLYGVVILVLAADQFHLDLAEVGAWIRAEHPALLWLCNPNNPTGKWLDRQALVRLAEACGSSGALLVIDEAYWRFLVPFVRALREVL
jgi:hypothetical protein